MASFGAHGRIGVLDPPGGAATGGTVDGWVVIAGRTATGADDVGGCGDGSSSMSCGRTSTRCPKLASMADSIKSAVA